MKKIIFPDEFMWGTSTAAQQIEGGQHAGGREDSIWDHFCRQPGRIAGGGDTSIAADHYHKWREDLDLMQASGIRNYRFSLSWPRLMRDGGQRKNSEGIKFYNTLIDGLLERGITPWVTLYHWDLPQKLQDFGGWTSCDIINHFEKFADVAFDHFGDRVKHWMILNEPSVTSLLGHGYGFHAPGLKHKTAYAASVHHQNLVIGHIARRAKTRNPDWQIGSAYTCLRTPPENETTPKIISETMHAFWNGNFFDPLFHGTYPSSQASLFKEFIKPGDMDLCHAPLDFIGLQHYSSIRAGHRPEWLCETFFGNRPSDVEATGIGWPIEPAEFEGTLKDFKKSYGDIPIIITENGAAYHDMLSENGSCHDPARIDYLSRYLTSLHSAMKAGVNVKGYFVWSFLDNFEWADGYDPRFGLVFVDYTNQCRRIPKDSLKWFSQIIDQNALI